MQKGANNTMAMKKSGLGRGLDSLLADNYIDEKSGDSGIVLLKTMDVEPNKEQARKNFDTEHLAELATSISQHGVLQPIVVRKKDNGFYEIIAGERRWRACKMAGVMEIPAIVKEIGDADAAEISLIENLQRENLNPVEEANGYKRLIEEFDLTQEEAANRVGKSRTSVANIMRILRLPAKVLTLVENSSLSYGHARALLPLCEIYEANALFDKAQHVVNASLSVRETEAMVRALLNRDKNPPVEKSKVEVSYYKMLENKVSASVGRRVSIKRNEDGSGKLSLNYSGTEDLEALLTSLCGEEIFADQG